MQTYKVEVDDDGNIRWCNGKNQFHRLDGPAFEWSNGDKSWYIEGKRHRLDGPAIEWSNGYKVWYIEGKRHRLDGPAIEYANGDKFWFIKGKRLTEKEFLTLSNDKKEYSVEDIKNMSVKEFLKLFTK